MKRLSLLFSLFVAFGAMAQQNSTPVNIDKEGVPVGTEVISNPASSTAFASIPATAEWAVFAVRTAGVHVSLDATAATTSKLYLQPGLYKTAFVPRGNPAPAIPLADYRFINSTDGSATIYVQYFKRRP